MWAIHQVYNTLLEVDENMLLKGSLAHRWDISPDNLVFTFHLRTDVFFTMILHSRTAADAGWSPQMWCIVLTG
jgi:ABC-type transport system substrate-binding protein